MNHPFGTLAICFLLVACGNEQRKSLRKNINEVSVENSLEAIENEIVGFSETQLDTIIIHEDHINGVPLPFPRQEMLGALAESFNQLTITKETGLQDGPDFPMYSFKNGESEICFFAMDWEDTLKLSEIYIKKPILKDEYGLKVGDGYQKIKALRKGEIKTYTDYHQHTYAYIDGSNILYEISSDLIHQEPIDYENMELTEEQINDWTIDYVIWRK